MWGSGRGATSRLTSVSLASERASALEASGGLDGVQRIFTQLAADGMGGSLRRVLIAGVGLDAQWTTTELLFNGRFHALRALVEARDVWLDTLLARAVAAVVLLEDDGAASTSTTTPATTSATTSTTTSATTSAATPTSASPTTPTPASTSGAALDVDEKELAVFDALRDLAAYLALRDGVAVRPPALVPGSFVRVAPTRRFKVPAGVKKTRDGGAFVYGPESNDVGVDPTSVLPDEILLRIMKMVTRSRLPLRAPLLRVNRRWRRVAADKSLWTVLSFQAGIRAFKSKVNKHAEPAYIWRVHPEAPKSGLASVMGMYSVALFAEYGSDWRFVHMQVVCEQRGTFWWVYDGVAGRPDTYQAQYVRCAQLRDPAGERFESHFRALAGISWRKTAIDPFVVHHAPSTTFSRYVVGDIFPLTLLDADAFAAHARPAAASQHGGPVTVGKFRFGRS